MSKDKIQKKFEELMKQIKSGEYKYQPKESEKIDLSNLELLLAETASRYERTDIVSGDAAYLSRTKNVA